MSKGVILVFVLLLAGCGSAANSAATQTRAVELSVLATVQPPRVPTATLNPTVNVIVSTQQAWEQTALQTRRNFSCDALIEEYRKHGNGMAFDPTKAADVLIVEMMTMNGYSMEWCTVPTHGVGLFCELWQKHIADCQRF